jgi:RNA polymerase sigma-70 factor (ECF subfamily)
LANSDDIGRTDPSTLKDSDLVYLINQSDNRAYKALFNRYYKVLLGTAINIIKDVDAAKDAVQEVFIQIWKNREKLEIQSSLESYLKRSVINRCLNAINREKRFEDEESLKHHQSSLTTVSEKLEADDMQRIIDNALEKVPEKSRLVFILKRQEGLSLKEIAEKLDISPKTVENQITRALKVLKEAIEPHLDRYNDSS